MPETVEAAMIAKEAESTRGLEREGFTMTVIAIPVSDERIAALRHRAEQVGLTPEEYLRRHVDELLDTPAPRRRTSMVELLATLPAEPSPRCYATWEEYERQLEEEKDAWER